jgi:hypothetical protein
LTAPPAITLIADHQSVTVTYRTHPAFGVGIVLFTANYTSPEVKQQVVTATIRRTVNLTDAGWGGYVYFMEDLVGGLLIAPNTSQAETEASFTPFASYLYNITGGQGGAVYNSSDSFYEWFYTTFVANASPQVGGNTYIASRLLSREIAENSPADAAKAINSIPGGVGIKCVFVNVFVLSHD